MNKKYYKKEQTGITKLEKYQYKVGNLRVIKMLGKRYYKTSYMIYYKVRFYKVGQFYHNIDKAFSNWEN